MNIDFNIKKGLQASFDQLTSYDVGCWYITTDKGNLYVSFDGVTAIHVNEAESFDPSEINARLDALEGREFTVVCQTRGELPTVGASGIVYVIADEETSYVYDTVNNKYVRTAKSYTDISRINGGSASELLS